MSGDPSKGVLRLEVPVELPNTTEVSIISSSSGSSEPRTISLNTLPPILLDVWLPPAYPYTPPQLRAVHATYSWLSLDGPGLRESLAGKWEEGQGVLYNWVEWIRTGEFLEELGMSRTVNGQQIIRYVHTLVVQLVAHPVSGYLTLRPPSYSPLWKDTTPQLRPLDFRRTRMNAKFA